MAWDCLGILDISLLVSGGTNVLSGGIYSLLDSNVKDEVKDLDGEEMGHHDVGRDLGDEETGLYDKTLDLKIGL